MNGIKRVINNNKEKLSFTNNYDGVKNVEIVFISVSTPAVNNKINLDYVFLAVKSL
jgi:UDPglucose 6-dehydrogenase